MICAEVGRDPASLGRSVGVSVRPLEAAGSSPSALSGSPEEITDAIRTFRDAGFSQVELMFGGGTLEGLEALAPVVEAIHADRRTIATGIAPRKPIRSRCVGGGILRRAAWPSTRGR